MGVDVPPFIEELGFAYSLPVEYYCALTNAEWKGAALSALADAGVEQTPVRLSRRTADVSAAAMDEFFAEGLIAWIALLPSLKKRVHSNSTFNAGQAPGTLHQRREVLASYLCLYGQAMGADRPFETVGHIRDAVLVAVRQLCIFRIIRV